MRKNPAFKFLIGVTADCARPSSPARGGVVGARRSDHAQVFIQPYVLLYLALSLLNRVVMILEWGVAKAPVNTFMMALGLAALLRARCAAQVSGQYSSFVQTGRDAIPLEPGGWLLSPIALEGTAVAPPVAQDLTGPDLTVASVRLLGFDHDLSWPALSKTARRFHSVLDTACGS